MNTRRTDQFEGTHSSTPDDRNPVEALPLVQIESVCAGATGRAEDESRRAIAAILAVGGDEGDIAAARAAGRQYERGVAEAAANALEETRALAEHTEMASIPEGAPAQQSTDALRAERLEGVRTELDTLRHALGEVRTVAACESVLLATEKFLDAMHGTLGTPSDAEARTLMHEGHEFFMNDVFSRYGELARAEHEENEPGSIPEDLAAYGTEHEVSERTASELVAVLSDRALSMEEATRHFSGYTLREQASLLRILGEMTAPYLRELQRADDGANAALISGIGDQWTALKETYRRTEQRFWNTIEETGMTREEYRTRIFNGGVTVGDLLHRGGRGGKRESERALVHLIAAQGPTEHDSSLSVDEFLRSRLQLQ